MNNLEPKRLDIKGLDVFDTYRYALDDMIKSVSSQRNGKISEAIKKSLSDLGYNFSNEEDFLRFCKKRLTYISSVSAKIIYLDYVHPQKFKCKLLRWIESTDFDYTNPERFIATQSITFYY